MTIYPVCSVLAGNFSLTCRCFRPLKDLAPIKFVENSNTFASRGEVPAIKLYCVTYLNAFARLIEILESRESVSLSDKSLKRIGQLKSVNHLCPFECPFKRMQARAGYSVLPQSSRLD